MKRHQRLAMWTIIVAIALPVGAVTMWWVFGFLMSNHPADRLELEVVSTQPDGSRSGYETATIEATFTNTTRSPLTELSLSLRALDRDGNRLQSGQCVLLTADQPNVMPRRRTTLSCEMSGIPVGQCHEVVLIDEWALDAEYDYSARLR